MQLSLKPIILLLVLSAILAVSCHHKPESAATDDAGPRVIVAHPEVVSSDSTIAPLVIPIDESKLKRSPLPQTQAMRTNLNVTPIREPVYTDVIEPERIRPGSDTFEMPEVVPAKPTSVLVRQPAPVTSFPMRMKDAANYNIQYLDVDQGMNSSYIWDIFEDRAGNFWFATDGGGVTRYDGKTFLHFTEENGLVSNYVRNIIQDRAGNLWFATINGLSKYDGVNFLNFDRTSGLKHNSIWSLIEDDSANIWFSTYGGGVTKFDGENFTHFTTKQGLPNDMVWTILEDHQGILWFGTNGAGLSRFDGTSFQNYSVANELGDSTILSIHEWTDGILYLGTQGGLIRFDEQSNNKHSTMCYTTEHGLPHNTIRSLFRPTSGGLWLGTYGGGVVKMDSLFTRFSTDEGMSDGHIVSITEDETGNIWFGTYGGGVCKYNPSSFQHYTDKQNLTNYFIWSVAQDSLGQIWYGTNGGGVVRYNNNSYTYLTTAEGLCSNVVRSVLCARDGSCWFGTYGGGITVLRGAELIQLSEADGLCSNNVLDIKQARNGNIWIATDGGGVSMYNGSSFTNYTTRQGLTSNYVRAMMEDSKGIFWLGSHAGLCSLDPLTNTVTQFNRNDEESFRSLWCATEDNNGNIWFGTGGYGVAKYDGSTFTFYTEMNGLSNNSVWSMVKDREGRIWMGTEKGLNCFVPGHDSVQKIVQFHREDGLKAEDFYLKSALLDRDNHLWWGTGKALSTLDLNLFELKEHSPKVQLNNIFLREGFIDYRNLRHNDSLLTREQKQINFDTVAPFSNLPSGMELPYSLNHVTFYFSATEWSAPHSIRYQYQLEGLDHDWSQPTAEHKADYRNIPYGNYTFRVRATSNTASFSNEAEISIVIHPPWWHTWWARTLGVIVLFALVVMYIRWRTRVLRLRQIELQRKVNDATYEIKQQKHLIEEKHKAITDSINYAERIQRSFLATRELLDANLKDYFVLYLPKDVVSGDFYWASKLNNGNFAFVTADSTGHGVPGAIMSLLNITSLEKACESETNPAKILGQTRSNIIERLSKDGTKDGGWDGMDCSFISFNFAKREMEIAAANNPVWILRNGTIIEIKPDRFPVGKHELDGEQFKNHVVPFEAGDIIYTMTDGYADQFGGPLGKKFKWKQLQKHLVDGSNAPMNVQRETLFNTITSWKSNLEQIDDICLVGIRMS